MTDSLGRRTISGHCKTCKKKVDAYVLKSWAKTDEDGDGSDKIMILKLTEHNYGLFKPRCKASGKTFKSVTGTFAV